jgi:hypothetical protein
MKKLIMICTVVMILTGAASMGFASILVDRGLPVYNQEAPNLNWAAGANRSNVFWADSDTTLMMGDDFTLPTSAASYHIDTIRVWISGDDSSVSLYLGTTGNLSLASTSYTQTSVTYSNGETYQGNSGAFRNIYQLDFAVDITASGGTEFNFAIAGDDTFLHASNAALSNSPQEGSDNWVHAWTIADGAWNYDWQSTNGGWDKDSDFNVQVLGIPEPATITLLCLGTLSFIGRKK